MDKPKSTVATTQDHARRQGRPHPWPAMVPVSMEPISPAARWLVFAFLSCVLEAAVRKWVYENPDALTQGVFYFIKDVFLVGAAVTGVGFSPRSTEIRWLRQTWTLPVVMILLASVVSLGGASLVGAVLSLRAWIVLPWLAVLIAPGLRSSRDVDYVVRAVVFAAVAIAALGVAQFYLPSSHVLNRGIGRDGVAIIMGTRTRANGTFAFVSGMASMALLASWAGSYLLLKHPKQSMLGGAALLAALTCGAVSISRGAMAMAILIPVVSFLLSQHGRKYAVLFVLLLVGSYMYGSAEGINEDEVDVIQATIVRTRRSEPIFERLAHPYREVYTALGTHPLGTGIGVAQSASRVLALDRRVAGGFETEWGRIVTEVGAVGLLAVFFIRFSLIVVLWRIAFPSWETVRSRRFYAIRLVSLVAIGVACVGNLTYDHIASTFVCIMTAIVLGSVEQEANEAQRFPVSLAD